MVGKDGGETGADDAFVARGFDNIVRQTPQTARGGYLAFCNRFLALCSGGLKQRKIRSVAKPPIALEACHFFEQAEFDESFDYLVGGYKNTIQMLLSQTNSDDWLFEEIFQKDEVVWCGCELILCKFFV